MQREEDPFALAQHQRCEDAGDAVRQDHPSGEAVIIHCSSGQRFHINHALGRHVTRVPRPIRRQRQCAITRTAGVAVAVEQQVAHHLCTDKEPKQGCELQFSSGRPHGGDHHQRRHKNDSNCRHCATSNDVRRDRYRNTGATQHDGASRPVGASCWVKHRLSVDLASWLVLGVPLNEHCRLFA